MASAQQQPSVSPEKIYDAPFITKSNVWKHFGFRKNAGKLDKSVALCKLCRAEIKYTGGTTNFATHLKRRHEIDLSSPTSTQPKASCSKSEESLSPFFQKLNHNSKRAQSVTAAITKFICKDLRPYSVVENEGFRDLVHLLEPRYVIPSRPHFSEKCVPTLYSETKAIVQQSLQRAERVAITTDGWTSCSTEAYITITSHHITTDWKMQNFVLQTRVLNEAHTGKNIAAVLIDACAEWEIGDKNPALVTDNASNMTTAGLEAKMAPHVKCFAHTINLASQKALKCNGAARLLGRVRRIVGFFHRSTTATAVLRQKQKLLGIAEHKLKQDVITRWNSSYDMLERFLEQQAAVVATLMDKELRRGAADVNTLSEIDITNAEDVVKVLAPLKIATTVMCEEQQPTLSVIAPLQAKMLQHFEEDEDDSPIVREMKCAMAKDLKDRYSGVQSVLNIASALDPRFKTLPYLDEEARDSTFESLTSEAATLWDLNVS